MEILFMLISVTVILALAAVISSPRRKGRKPAVPQGPVVTADSAEILFKLNRHQFPRGLRLIILNTRISRSEYQAVEVSDYSYSNKWVLLQELEGDGKRYWERCSDIMVLEDLNGPIIDTRESDNPNPS
jgi:hypothetical protein